MNQTSASNRRRASRGFSLLEVMCAFAILATITGFLTTIFVQSVDRGTDALAKRELREAADTLFRKIIYEHVRYKDGQSQTLDDAYGEFAGLRGWARDRWRVYTYELEKKLETVVGTARTGEESVFSDEDSNTDESTTYFGEEGEAADEAPEGQRLLRLTMRIYETEEPGDKPIFVLTTWIDPRDPDYKD
jgi:prepilin-type N-terminal cleavage/methylation domain-containing protein